MSNWLNGFLFCVYVKQVSVYTQLSVYKMCFCLKHLTHVYTQQQM